MTGTFVNACSNGTHYLWTVNFPFEWILAGFGNVVPTGVQISVAHTHVTHVISVVPNAPIVTDVPPTHAEKLEKFNGTKFRRWKQKILGIQMLV